MVMSVGERRGAAWEPSWATEAENRPWVIKRERERERA